MLDPPYRFFLQALDPDHGCPVLEAKFEVGDLEDLRVLLRPDCDSDPDLRGTYHLDNSDLAALAERFDVAFDPGGRDVLLKRWHALRAVPYLVHTGYELALLIDGRKKFAREFEAYPPHVHHREERYDRYVAAGLLHKEVFLEPFQSPLRTTNGHLFEGEREVCYALKGEEWRIRAWRLIRAAHRKSKWNDDFERLQGMLFGYDDWEMDWWLAHRRTLAAAIRPAQTAVDEPDLIA